LKMGCRNFCRNEAFTLRQDVVRLSKDY
jgi:hypothetical protein